MITKKKSGIKLLMITLGALLAVSLISSCAAPGGPATEEKKPIVFGYATWDTQMFMSKVAGFITEHGYGYEVEYPSATNVAIIKGIERGDIDIHMEIAERSLKEPLQQLLDSGQGVAAGISYPGTWQGWLVPTYMIEDGLLPANVSVDDMPEYWELFKDAEVPTKGRFYSCIPGWQCTKTNELKMEAYGLDEYYNIFTPGSDAALSASMFGAYEKHEPWFGYYWSPTWVLSMIDMTPVAEPVFSEDLWTEEAKYACEYPLDGNVIAAHVSLRDRAPEVMDFLGKYQHPTEELNDALLYMQETEASIEETVIWFLNNYESTWTQWVPSDVTSKVKAALA